MAQFSHRPTSPHLPLIMIDTVDTVVLIMIDTVDTSINFPCIKQGMAGLLEVAALLLDRSCRLVDYAPCHAANVHQWEITYVLCVRLFMLDLFSLAYVASTLASCCLLSGADPGWKKQVTKYKKNGTISGLD